MTLFIMQRKCKDITPISHAKSWKGGKGYKLDINLNVISNKNYRNRSQLESLSSDATAIRADLDYQVISYNSAYTGSDVILEYECCLPNQCKHVSFHKNFSLLAYDINIEFCPLSLNIYSTVSLELIFELVIVLPVISYSFLLSSRVKQL